MNFSNAIHFGIQFNKKKHIDLIKWLCIPFIFYYDFTILSQSSTGAEQSGIRKADVATEPRLYFNKLPPNQSQAKDYLRSLVEPHGEIIDLHVPKTSKVNMKSK